MKGKRTIKLIILAAIFAVFLVSGLAFAGVKSTMNSKNAHIMKNVKRPALSLEPIKFIQNTEFHIIRIIL